MKTLSNAAEIVEVLGGPEKVAKMTRAKNAKATWNWHGYFDAFPANTYAVMIKRLNRRGYTASPTLWKQKGFDEKPKRAT